MGLKSSSFLFFCVWWVKIRPKWDWNIFIIFYTYYTYIVKIRPKWDWNSSSAEDLASSWRVKIRPKWDWNQEILEIIIRHTTLKSDQNGIEMDIIYHDLSRFLNILVKIRPKWDWNTRWRRLLTSSGTVKIRPKWDWNFPQPSYRVRFLRVKIRPKWDWNRYSSRSDQPWDELKSDQNGIEINTPTKNLTRLLQLKSDQNGIEMYISSISLFISVHIVKIRPKWDWNVWWSQQIHSLTSRVKIRPKWDWNRKELYRALQKALKLKSDQNGIEIHTPTFFPCIHPRVKIRPKWDWNDFWGVQFEFPDVG